MAVEGIEQQIDKILQQAEKSINQVLNTTGQDEMKRSMQKAVEMNVYGAYDPTVYERRKRAGGLADPDQYVFKPASGKNHTVTLADRRRESGVVESGSGYTYGPKGHPGNPEMWWPRPYSSDAENNPEMLAAIDNVLDQVLSFL